MNFARRSSLVRPGLALAVLTPLVASCGGGLAMEPRYVTLHNAMVTLGFAQSGGVLQGSLSESAERTFPVEGAPGECMMLVAIAESGVGDVDLVVRDAGGNELAHDETDDAQATTRFCAPYAGRFDAVVRMARGSGGYIATAWSGAMSGGAMGSGGEAVAAARPPHGGPGTCEEPWVLAEGERRHGDTSSGDATSSGSCAAGNAPEHVYSIAIEQRSLVTVALESSFDGALYLLGECGAARSELACNDDAPNTSRSEVQAVLEPGTYTVVVDGFGAAMGEYDVSYRTAPVRSIAEICRTAPAITPGQTVTGTTTGEAGLFEGSCAGEGADRVYTLDVAQPSRARVRMQSTHDGVVYLRSACADATTELACNDDYQDTRHSLASATLQPGRYFVFADGFSAFGGPNAAGDYSLDVELAPTAGSGAPGDTCAAPVALQPGQPVTPDTFRLADDSAGSCGGAGSPDAVYRLDLRSRTRIRVSFGAGEFQPVVYLQSTCGDARSEVACVTAASGQPLDQTLAAGTYFLVVDGADGSGFGTADVRVQLDDLGALETACRSAPMLRPGRQVVGNTTGSTDRFQASCAGGARSPDLIYRLQIQRRSLVRISSEQTDWDGAIYLRRDCLDAQTELGCNDDAGDNRHSMIETILEPGTYTVFMDGFATGSQGPFTIDVDITNP